MQEDQGRFEILTFYYKFIYCSKYIYIYIIVKKTVLCAKGQTLYHFTYMKYLE